MHTREARSIRLPPELESVRQARTFVAGALAAHLDDPADVLLMTSELVANVVLHVQTDVTLTVWQGPPVRVAVHNGEAATEAFRDLVRDSAMPKPSSSSGRGLGLVRSLATRVGLDDDPGGGKVVWFEYAGSRRDEA